jgi:hypothetical protein
LELFHVAVQGFAQSLESVTKLILESKISWFLLAVFFSRLLVVSYPISSSKVLITRLDWRINSA